jgi:hypothetical protein
MLNGECEIKAPRTPSQISLKNLSQCIRIVKMGDAVDPGDGVDFVTVMREGTLAALPSCNPAFTIAASLARPLSMMQILGWSCSMRLGIGS